MTAGVWALAGIVKAALSCPSESVTGIQREDLIDFVEERFTSENMVVSIVGDYKMKDLIRRCEKYIVPRFQSSSKPNFDDTFVRKHFVKKTNRANYQSHIMIGAQAYNINDDRIEVIPFESLIDIKDNKFSNKDLIDIKQKYKIENQFIFIPKIE